MWVNGCAAMSVRIGQHSGQPACHPKAAPVTLRRGDRLFGCWRQSLDRRQSICAIHNLSDEPVSVPAMSLNLIEGDMWRDLLAPDDSFEIDRDIHFGPYQCRWISNR